MLTDRDRQLLAFEERWAGQPVGREVAALPDLGLRRARHGQLLAQLLEREDALAEYPSETGAC
jgi:hypothetical protein